MPLVHIGIEMKMKLNKVSNFIICSQDIYLIKTMIGGLALVKRLIVIAAMKNTNIWFTGRHGTQQTNKKKKKNKEQRETNPL